MDKSPELCDAPDGSTTCLETVSYCSLTLIPSASFSQKEKKNKSEKHADFICNGINLTVLVCSSFRHPMPFPGYSWSGSPPSSRAQPICDFLHKASLIPPSGNVSPALWLPRFDLSDCHPRGHHLSLSRIRDGGNTQNETHLLAAGYREE